MEHPETWMPPLSGSSSHHVIRPTLYLWRTDLANAEPLMDEEQQADQYRAADTRNGLGAFELAIEGALEAYAGGNDKRALRNLGAALAIMRRELERAEFPAHEFRLVFGVGGLPQGGCSCGWRHRSVSASPELAHQAQELHALQAVTGEPVAR